MRAAYVRIDSIETAISRAEGQFVQTNGWDLPPGYLVGYDVAADQLRNGLDVVAESVNPLPASRRAETRVLDVAGLAKPTWDQITRREYAIWERDRVLVDTAILDVDHPHS